LQNGNGRLADDFCVQTLNLQQYVKMCGGFSDNFIGSSQTMGEIALTEKLQ
jgi:hypothetical protein